MVDPVEEAVIIVFGSFSYNTVYIDLAKPKSGAPGPGCSKRDQANPG